MSADLIARLIESGTPAALVAEVALALGRAQGDQDALSARRERDASRQRDKRERERLSRDVTVRHGTSEDTADAPPTLDKESFPQTPFKEINPTPGVNTRARKGSAWPVPEGVDPGHWRDLLANRKSKRLTNTPTAHQRLLDDLGKLSDDEWPPGRLVEFAAGRGWGAIFDPRKHEQRNGQRPHHDNRNRGGSLFRAVRDDLAGSHP